MVCNSFFQNAIWCGLHNGYALLNPCVKRGHEALLCGCDHRSYGMIRRRCETDILDIAIRSLIPVAGSSAQKHAEWQSLVTASTVAAQNLISGSVERSGSPRDILPIGNKRRESGCQKPRNLPARVFSRR
jgi:hypothetical protein